MNRQGRWARWAWAAALALGLGSSALAQSPAADGRLPGDGPLPAPTAGSEAEAAPSVAAPETGDTGKKRRPSLRDPLDGQLDLSATLLETRGFVPVPILITEPALGGYGAGLAPVFISRNQPVERYGKLVPAPPNVTAAAGAVTGNGTWVGGLGRMASVPKYGLHYTVGAGYGDIHMDFYETLPSGEDRAFAIHGTGGALFVRMAKDLFDPRLTLGFQYLLGRMKVGLDDAGELPPFLTDRTLDSVVSTLGPVVEFDARDNIFSPDSGSKLHAHYDLSHPDLGSDYRYGRFNAYYYGHLPIGRNEATGTGWIASLRADWQQADGEPPFYMLPFVDMRGIPSARYQGRTIAILESEQRIDFTRRWSAVVFGGIAKAFDSPSEAGAADLLSTYGAGFRYLVAREFKLRMGIDVARGPEESAYYIVFGSAWGR